MSIDFFCQAFRNCAQKRAVFRFAYEFLPVAKVLADHLDGLMALVDRFQYLLFCQELAIALDHKDRIFCSCDDQVQLRIFLLFQLSYRGMVGQGGLEPPSQESESWVLAAERPPCVPHDSAGSLHAQTPPAPYGTAGLS